MMELINKSKRNLNLSPVKLIVLLYFVAILIATAILNLPFLLEPGQSLSFFDSFFTAISAISVTGLSVISIEEVFNTAGYFALSLIFQLGGIGIMTLGTAVYIILGKKIGIRERQLILIDQNQTSFSGLVRLMKKIIQTLVLIELIGMIILSVYFLGVYDTWQEAFLNGYFASVSATTNAGFNITGASLLPFADDLLVQIVTMVLMVLGAIGFPVLIEVQQWLYSKKNNDKTFRFTTFMKLTTLTYFILLVIGAIVFFALENQGAFSSQSSIQKMFSSLFYSVTTRSGGQTIMSMAEFSTPTLIVSSLLMFIGASPSSVGGGIRTTTLAVIILAVYNYAKGRQTVKVFKREISDHDTIRSFVVFVTSLFLTVTSIFMLSITESFSLIEIAYEVFSAFGTAGLSLGITAGLSTFGRIVIMLLMFIGRIGIFSFLFLIRGEPNKDLYRYPKAKMLIG